MKRFIKLLLWFLPLPVLLVGLNIYADPANLLRSVSIADEVIRIQQDGLNAAVPDNYNDRTLSLEYIERMTKAPKVAVLGSSRAIQVSGEMLGTDSFVNNSVTGGVLGDFSALWQAYVENEVIPEYVIIEPDPWAFDAYRVEQRYRYSYGSYYSDFSRRVLGEKSDYASYIYEAKIEPFFSLSYFRNSVSYIKSGDIYERGVYATESRNDQNRAVVRSDGSYAYPLSYVHPIETKFFDDLAVTSLTIKLETETCVGVSPVLASRFEALLRDIIAHGATPVVLLSAYYPSLYDELASDTQRYKSLFEIESYVREACAQLGVDVVGSISPHECGFSETDFIDALHLKEEATARLCKGIKLK